MTRSVITAVAQTIEMNDVIDVIVTPIEPDNDGYVRELRIMGTADGSANAPVLTLTIRLKSGVRANLDVTTPALDF